MENQKYKNRQPISFQTDMGFAPPQVIELEEAVLGAILIEKEAYPSIEEILKPDDFYVEANKLIYQAIRSLHSESKPADMLTVTEQLKKQIS